MTLTGVDDLCRAARKGALTLERRFYDGRVPELSDPKLFAVYLGGDPAPGRLSEDHEVVHVVADDIKGARAAARTKWSGLSRPHVDAVKLLNVVDGFSIGLELTQDSESDEVDLTFEPQQG